MQRTTQVELINAVRALNAAAGYPDDAMIVLGSTAVPGAFRLYGAYGGWQLLRYTEASFAQTGIEIVTHGFRTKREVRELVEMLTYGIRCAEKIREGATV